MAGTLAGGKKAAATNKAQHGANFYKRIGALGGSAPSNKPKGFALNPQLASIAGTKGGKISRRPPAKKDKILSK